MQKLTHLIAIVLVAAALAGCANNDDTKPTPTSPATTPTPATSTPTPATTIVPSVTPPTSPTSVIPTPVANLTKTSISAVRVVSLTDSVGAGGDADVCWRVEGNGTIGHTAIHYDTVSHPNSTSFTDYPQAVYPDNGPATTTGTFKLPGTFCAQLPDLNATIYLRAHALAAGTPPTQVLSVEKIVPVNRTTNITFVNFREIFPATFSNNVCWEVTGLTGTSTHTAIHIDSVSHPNSTSFTDYKGGAFYADNRVAAGFSVTVPGEFCANITMPASGAVYMRAHIIHNVSGTATHFLSEERVVESAPRVSVTGGLPSAAAAGTQVNVCWRVEGAGSTVHTALHHDTTSHPDANHTAFGLYAGGAAYPNNAQPSAAPWTLPGPFCANLTMPATGTLYFRPHVFFGPGATNSEIGPEYSIRVGVA